MIKPQCWDNHPSNRMTDTSLFKDRFITRQSLKEKYVGLEPNWYFSQFSLDRSAASINGLGDSTRRASDFRESHPNLENERTPRATIGTNRARHIGNKVHIEYLAKYDGS